MHALDPALGTAPNPAKPQPGHAGSDEMSALCFFPFFGAGIGMAEPVGANRQAMPEGEGGSPDGTGQARLLETSARESLAATAVPLPSLPIRRPGVAEKSLPPLPLGCVPLQGGAAAGPGSPAPADVPPAAPVDEAIVRIEELADRFDQRLLSMVRRDEKVMRITLEPASMGRMTVLCREENSSLMVEIHVQSLAVRDLVARQEDDIRRAMQACDVTLGGFDVLLDEQRDGRGQSCPHRREGRRVVRGIAPAFEGQGGAGFPPGVRHGRAASWVA